jgi:hypothetical protein
VKPEKEKKRPYRPAYPVEFIRKQENEWNDKDRHNGFSIADAYAIQACINGTADARQQKRAMDWILNVAAKTFDQPYFDNARDTDFALGKAFVGKQIILLSKLDTGELEKILKSKQP